MTSSVGKNLIFHMVLTLTPSGLAGRRYFLDQVEKYGLRQGNTNGLIHSLTPAITSSHP